MGKPPRLLVSVFEADEVEAALAGGAEIIDVKDPAEGSLGAPTPGLLRAVAERVRGRGALSAALGDAPHLPGTLALAAAGAAACGTDYLKVGLFGSRRPEQAVALLRAVARAAGEVDERVRVVAVAYADASRVGALPASELPRAAAEAGVHAVMLDTALKDGASLRDALDDDAITSFVAEAQGLGLETALAGALGSSDLEWCAGLGVGIVGVRGSACAGGRRGRVEASRVRALREALQASDTDPDDLDRGSRISVA